MKKKRFLKVLNNWVKKSSNSVSFIKDLTSEIGSSFNEPISEFASHKAKVLLR